MLSHRNTMLWKYYWVKSTTKFLELSHRNTMLAYINVTG